MVVGDEEGPTQRAAVLSLESPAEMLGSQLRHGTHIPGFPCSVPVTGHNSPQIILASLFTLAPALITAWAGKQNDRRIGLLGLWSTPAASDPAVHFPADPACPTLTADCPRCIQQAEGGLSETSSGVPLVNSH